MWIGVIDLTFFPKSTMGYSLLSRAILRTKLRTNWRWGIQGERYVCDSNSPPHRTDDAHSPQGTEVRKRMRP